MSATSLPAEAVAALAERDAALADLTARLQAAEARAERAEADLAALRAEQVVVLKRLQAAEAALSARPGKGSEGGGWLRRLTGR